MKKLLALLFLLTGAAKAEVVYQNIGPFGGLNNTDSPIVIPSNKSQDLLNVDVSPGGASVKKRRGYGLTHTLTVSTSPVHGVHTFYDSLGNQVDIYFNDTNISASVGGASFTVLSSTGSNGATWQCVDSQGYAYCQSSARTSLLKTNGTTFSYINTVNSTGTMVAVTPERLVTSGFAEAPNRIDFSKSNDFSNWTIGSAATSAAQFTVVSPGSRITMIAYAFGRIMWFKDSSFGFILIGQEEAQADWEIKTISPTVGTLDNSYIYQEGIFYFRGQDGHIWSYDGSNLEKMTRDLQGTISTSQTRTVSSWIQTSQSDWSQGFSSSTVYIDTVTSAGSVQMTFPDTFNSYRDGSSSSKLVWVTTCTHGISNDCPIGTVSASGGELLLSRTGSGASSSFINAQTSTRLNDFRRGTTYYVKLSTIPLDFAGGSYGSGDFVITLSTSNNPTLGSGYNIPHYKPGGGGTGESFTFVFESSSTGDGQFHLDGVCNDDDGCQSTTSTLNFSCPAEIRVYIATTTYSVTINDTAIANGTHAWSPTRFDHYLWLGLHMGNIPGTLKIDTFGVAIETGTYQSAVKNAPSLTSWDTFQADYQDNGGSHSFYMRSATGAFTVYSATPAWSSITVGAIPSISTNPYFQVRDIFSISVATYQPVLNSFTQNWFEGSAADKAYAAYHNDSLWWSIASGVAVSTNNRVLRYDLINNDWYLYDIGTNGMLVKNNTLYFGGSSQGKIFKFGDTNSDAGEAINSYWKSKDFVVGDPLVEKEFRTVSVSAGSVANSSMTVTYAVDGSSTTTYQFPLYAGEDYYKHFNKNIPLGRVGDTFNVKFGNNSADQPFEVFTIQFSANTKPWVPSR